MLITRNVMKRNAGHAARAVLAVLSGERSRVLISCRSYKIREGRGCWHWGTRFLLNCDPERPFDPDDCAAELGISPADMPLFTYGLRRRYPSLDVECWGDTLLIMKKEVTA